MWANSKKYFLLEKSYGLILIEEKIPRERVTATSLLTQKRRDWGIGGSVPKGRIPVMKVQMTREGRRPKRVVLIADERGGQSRAAATHRMRVTTNVTRTPGWGIWKKCKVKSRLRVSPELKRRGHIDFPQCLMYTRWRIFYSHQSPPLVTISLSRAFSLKYQNKQLSIQLL